MSIVSLPRRRPTGVRAGGMSVKNKPTLTCTGSGLPVGCRCSCTTRSLPGLEAPRHAIGRRARLLPGRPAEQVARRIRGVLHHPADVPGFGIGRVQPARRARAVDAEVGVMHAAAVARPELDRPHVARGGRRDRQNEGAKEIWAVGPQGVRLGHR